MYIYIISVIQIHIKYSHEYVEVSLFLLICVYVMCKQQHFFRFVL